MRDIRILGAGTAVPDHIGDQAYVRRVVEHLFQERVENLERLLRVFDHLHILPFLTVIMSLDMKNCG